MRSGLVPGWSLLWIVGDSDRISDDPLRNQVFLSISRVSEFKLMIQSVMSHGRGNRAIAELTIQS
jgi:hypothetical protein